MAPAAPEPEVQAPTPEPVAPVAASPAADEAAEPTPIDPLRPTVRINLDDENAPSMCSAPCSFEAPPGTHLVYFTSEGFQAVPRQINVVAKETVKTTAVLTPLTGSLVVQADERDAIEAEWLRRPPTPAAAFAQGSDLLARWSGRVRERLHQLAGRQTLRPWYLERYWRTRNQWAGLEPGVMRALRRPRPSEP